MLRPGMYIWEDGGGGLAQAQTPLSLSRAHALWDRDVTELGPWTPMTAQIFHDFEPSASCVVEPVLRLWKAAGRRSAHLPALGPDDSRVAGIADSAVEGGAGGEVIVICGPSPSSMDVAQQLAQWGMLPDFASVLAVSQTSGRGQLRRPWASPPGNVYAAWLWPKLEGPWDALTSLLAGYSLCKAMRSFCPDILVKWPNDLLVNGAKIGGILVEERRGRIIVGAGLNSSWAPPRDALRDEHAVPAGAMDFLQGMGPLSLWLALCAAARKELDAALALSPRAFLDLMEPMLAWRGRTVRAVEDGREIRGTIAGLASDGGLRLQGETHTVLYSGGVHPLY